MLAHRLNARNYVIFLMKNFLFVKSLVRHIPRYPVVRLDWAFIRVSGPAESILACCCWWDVLLDFLTLYRRLYDNRSSILSFFRF